MSQFASGGRGTLWTLRASGRAALLPNWEKFAAQLGNKISPVRKQKRPGFPLSRPSESGCLAYTAIRLRAHTHTLQQPCRTPGRKRGRARSETPCGNGKHVVTLHRRKAGDATGHHTAGDT